jgi:hypothetical protein
MSDPLTILYSCRRLKLTAENTSSCSMRALCSYKYVLDVWIAQSLFDTVFTNCTVNKFYLNRKSVMARQMEAFRKLFYVFIVYIICHVTHVEALMPNPFLSHCQHVSRYFSQHQVIPYYEIQWNKPIDPQLATSQQLQVHATHTKIC